MVARGIRNNNPLNIRKGNNWQGELKVQSDPQFEQFESMVMGIRAAFKLVKNYVTGFNGMSPKYNTIELIVRRWAPPSENDTESYIKAVAQAVGIPKNQKISFQQRKYMVSILQAMAKQECGQLIDRSLFESAYDML